MAVTITPDSKKTVTTTTETKKVTINTQSGNSVSISSGTNSVVNVTALGPRGLQGPQGIQGPSGSFQGGSIQSDTTISGSLTVSGSNVDFSNATSITGSVFTGVFQGALSSSAQIATDISGSTNSLSSSLSTRLTTDETNITNLQTDSGSFSTRLTDAETELSNTLISSSAQIASDISGSFTQPSSSFSTRVTTLETDLSTEQTNIDNLQTDSGSFSTRITAAESELGNTLISGSAQVVSSLLNQDVDLGTGDLTSTTGSFGRVEATTISASRIDVDATTLFIGTSEINEANAAKLSDTLLSGSAQIASDISGSFTQPSASFSTRVTSNETNITNLQTDSGSFSTRITTEETNVDNLQTDSGSFSTRVTTNETDITNLQTDSGSFSTRITTEETNVDNLQTDSGSFSTRVTTNETDITNLQTDSGSFSTRITATESELGNTLISSSAQIATDISGSFTEASSSISTRLTDAETELSNTLISSSAQIASDISGSFTAGTGVTITSGEISIGQEVETTSNVNFGTLTTSGDVTVGGNLDVQGTTTSIDSATLNIGDKNITIGSGSTTSAQLNEAGIDFGLGGDVANLRYRHSDTSITSSVDFRAPNFYGTFQGALSSSAQIADDISGSFTAASSSLSSRIATAEAELENTLISSSAQVDHDTTTNFVSNEHIDHSGVTLTAGDGLTGGGDITTNRSFAVDATVLRTTGDNILSGSAQIATDISGSFTQPSSSFSTRVTTLETDLSTEQTNIDNLQTDSGSFSTRITAAESELGNTLISSSAQLATDISGSFVEPSASISTRLTTAEAELSNTLVSSSTQIDHDTTTNFVSNEHIDHTSVTLTAGDGLSGGGDISSNRSFAVDATVLRTTGNNIVSGSAQITGFGFISGSLDGTLSSSAQIADDISGSFTEVSASLSSRISDSEAGSITSVTAGTGLTGGGSSGALTLNVVGGDGITANADDIEVDNTVLRTTGYDVISGSAQITEFGFISSSVAVPDGTVSSSAQITQYHFISSSAAVPDGTDGQALITDGSGVLTFDDVKVVQVVKNISGTTLEKGTPVHAVGSVGNTPTVIAASASNASTMPATFVLDEQLVNDAEGRAIGTGFINNVNTVGFTEGKVVYVGENGGYTQQKPTGTNLIQNLGIVTKVDANGSGFIYGSGRANDVPNLLDNTIFYGSGSNQAQQIHISGALQDTTLGYAIFDGRVEASSFTGSLLSDNGVLSSSAQIASDISGSFVEASASFSTRITTEETNVDNLQTDSGSFSTRVTTNETNISNLQTDSGSFSTRVSSNETNITNLQTDSGSFSTRVTTNETDISNLQTDSGSFSTRVTTNETDISNLQTDSGSFSTRVTTLETDLSTEQTNIDNLQTDSGSFSTRITTAESELSNTLFSGSAQVDHDLTTNFVSNEHIDHTSVSISAGDGLSGGGTIAANRTLSVDATVLRTTGDGVVSSSAQIASDISGSFTAGTGLDLSSGQFSVDVSDFMSNGSDNRILTATGTDAINAEANFTIDGTSLQLGDSKILSLGNSDDLQIHHTINQNYIELNTGNLTIRDESDNNIMRINKDGGVDILEGNLTVTGNLEVQGTTTTIDSTEVSLGDRILTLNAASAAGDGGIYVNDASTAETGSLLWDVSEDRWIAGLSGSEVNVVTISSTDTLTNKTINASNNTLSNIGNSSLTNSSVNYGGVTVALGDSDTTPAFDLTDATSLPIVNGTTGTLTVARGGTGATTFTSNAILTGNGTSAIQAESNLTFGGSALTLTGDLNISGYIYDSTNSGNRLDLDDDSDAGQANQVALYGINHLNLVADNTNNGTGEIRFWKGAVSDLDSGTNTRLMTIDNSGNVTFNTGDVKLGATKKLYLDGGSDTYIFEESADNVIHYVGGQNKLRFNSTGTILNDAGLALDFRVEGDTDDHLFFVDGSADKVGISTNSPQEKLHLKDGNFRVGGDNAGSDYGAIFTPADAASYWHIYNDAGGELVFGRSATIGSLEKVRIDSSGFVGIGTDSPLDLLHIKSTSTDARLVLDGHSGYDAELKFTESGSVKYTIGHDAASGNFVIGTTNVDTNQRLVIDTSGNVGIGQTSPSARLDIVASGNTGIEVTGGSGYLAGYFQTDFDYVAKFVSLDASSAIVIEDSNSTANYNRIGVATNDMFFVTNNSEAIRIDSSQNVGIGETSPEANLHIKNASAGTITTSNSQLLVENNTTARFTLLVPNNNAGKIEFGDPQNQDEGIIEYNHSTNYMAFTTSGSEAMRIDDSQNVGIGTTSPSEKLQINSNITYDAKIRLGDNGTSRYFLAGMLDSNTGMIGYVNGTPSHLAFHTGTGATGSEKMRITTDGYVGIGTNSPNAALEIKDYFQIEASSTYMGILGFNRNVNTGAILNGSYGAYQLHNYQGKLYLQVYNSAGTAVDQNALVVDNSANVGIGTTSPGAKLEISNDAGAAQNTVLVIKSDDPDGDQGASSTADIDFHIWDSNTRLSTPQARIGVVGDGTASQNSEAGGRLAFYTNVESYSSPSLTERMRINSSGYVGIGTTSPGTKLEVKADGDTSQEVIKIRNSSGTEIMTIAAIDSNGDGYINFNSSPGTINTNGGDLILSPGGSGNVGIGTTNPGYKLSVENELNVFSSGDAASPKIEGHLLRVTTTTDNNPNIEHFFVENDGLAYGMRWVYDGATNNDFRLYRHNNDVSGVEVIRFDRTTNNIYAPGSLRVNGVGIGIGNSAPQNTLHVDATTSSNVAARFNTDSTYTFIDLYNDDTNRVQIGNADDGDFIIRTNDAIRMQISSSGYVGIGNTSPNALLDVGGDADAFALIGRARVGFNSHSDYASFQHRDSATSGGYALLQQNNGSTFLNAASGQSIFFRINNSDKMKMDSSGNVGIGTTSPGYTLDVSGSARVLGGSLSSTSGSSVDVAIFDYTNGNNSHLEIRGIREAAGSSWTTAASRIQQVTDVTDQAYIQFNGNGNTYGLSFGTGAGAGSVERMRINSSGGIKVGPNGGDTAHTFEIDTSGNANHGLFINADEARGAGDYALYIDDEDPNGRGSLVIDNASGTGIKVNTQGSSTGLHLVAVDNGSAPSFTVHQMMQGFEGRGNGIFHTDEDYAGEWFVGNPYQANNASWQVGYDASGGQAEYKAQAKLYIDGTNSRVGVNTSSPAVTFHINTESDGSVYFTRGGSYAYSIEHDTSQFYFYNRNISKNVLEFDHTGEVTINEDGHSTVDFRVEGDTNTHLLFTDASADRVGIGTSAPQVKLDVVSGSAHIRGVDSEGYTLGLGQFADNPTSALYEINTFDNTAGGTSGLTSGDHLEIYGKRWGFQNSWVRGGQGGVVPVMGLYSSGDATRLSLYKSLNPTTDATYAENVRLNVNGNSWFDGGNVGIGTAALNAGAKLNVVSGVSNYTAQFSRHDADDGLFLHSEAEATHYNWKISTQDNVDAGFEITPSTAVGNRTFSTPAFVIKADTGNVGIGGTPEGNAKLDVKMTGDSQYVKIERNSATGRSQLQFANESGGELWRVGLTGGGSEDFTFWDGDTNHLVLDRSANSATFGGDVNAVGDVIAYYSSDKRLKDNIIRIENPLEKIEKIGGYTFDWNDKQQTYTGKDVGIIAQEIEKVLPEIVTTRDTGYKAVKYEKIVPLLIESIKELKTIVETQQKEINELKNKS